MGLRQDFSAFAVDALAPLVDLAFPPRCPLCGEATATQGGLCPTCWSGLAIPGEPACQTCGRPFHPDSGLATAQCAPCMADPPRHAGIAAATIYNDASRKLVLAFKHGHRIALARQMAQLMAARIPPGADEERLIIPVPLHRWRLWRRGFNQAALLARELEVLGAGKLAVDALVRRKATPMLGGMRRNERQRALSGAIEVRKGQDAILRGRQVILVDDVLTSGATSSACITALRKAGASSVLICCFARVLNED